MSFRDKRKAVEARLGERAFDWAIKKVRRQTPAETEEMGARLGRMLMRLSRKHRERALDNLSLAMPELAQSDRDAIMRGCFEHFGRVSAEFMRTALRTPEELLATTEDAGREIVEEALSYGKGVIGITGHFGNWERHAHYASTIGFPLYVVARDANQGGVNEKLMELRAIAGATVLSRGNAARQILTLLRQGKIVAMLPDQNSDEIFVPFFNKPCGTVLGPAVMHMRTGAPICSFFYPRVGVNQYRVVALPLLQPVPGYEGSPEGMTRSINLALETVIREYPEQWLWFHNRWKSARARGLL